MINTVCVYPDGLKWPTLQNLNMVQVRIFKKNCFAGFHPVSSFCSIWLWRGKGLEWDRWHRVLYGLPWELQQQSPLPVEHPGAWRQSGPPPFPQLLPGGESDVHEWQSQPHRQNRTSRYVYIGQCILFTLPLFKNFQSGFFDMIIWERLLQSIICVCVYRRWVTWPLLTRIGVLSLDSYLQSPAQKTCLDIKKPTSIN